MRIPRLVLYRYGRSKFKKHNINISEANQNATRFFIKGCVQYSRPWKESREKNFLPKLGEDFWHHLQGIHNDALIPRNLASSCL